MNYARLARAAGLTGAAVAGGLALGFAAGLAGSRALLGAFGESDLPERIGARVRMRKGDTPDGGPKPDDLREEYTGMVPDQDPEDLDEDYTGMVPDPDVEDLDEDYTGMVPDPDPEDLDEDNTGMEPDPDVEDLEEDNTDVRCPFGADPGPDPADD